MLHFISYMGLVRGSAETRDVLHWHGPKEIDHHEAVYLMATMALGLDFQSCQNHGLRLLMSLGYLPCMGLMDMGPRACVQRDIGNMITICNADIPKFGEISPKVR